MRRFTAMLVLALLGATIPVPLLHAALSDPESDLPLCCRIRGKHHCAMMDQYLRMKASGAPTFTCASRPLPALSARPDAKLGATCGCNPDEAR